MEVTKAQRIDSLFMALRHVDSIAANGIDRAYSDRADYPQEDNELIAVLERHLLIALGGDQEAQAMLAREQAAREGAVA